ncbi:MAG: fumarylacetoacetate hydrolase family protein [Candidatus Thermoplasmatota archaeon]|jgi:2-keto-4-pentenoate hydratase/2-oxohepta-3-ene-1,7-dioic acid hydratase in catechol pathway|nr:fumarylacetoacetate hydrolase family protein [Candidatus Thermoplasmatota archaeon]
MTQNGPKRPTILMDGTPYELHPSKIVCLLRSYAAHAKELNNPVPERPRFFLKPPSSLLEDHGTVVLPDGVGPVHHEVELAVIIGKRGNRITETLAGDHILGYTVMLDLTARELQDEARSKGLPWTEAKGYDTFAPVGPLGATRARYDWRGRRVHLKVNGTLKQDGNTDMLLFTVEQMVSRISSVMTLEEGDIILTGTPAGVGPIQHGDRLEASVDGLGTLEVTVR